MIKDFMEHRFQFAMLNALYFFDFKNNDIRKLKTPLVFFVYFLCILISLAENLSTEPLIYTNKMFYFIIPINVI